MQEGYQNEPMLEMYVFETGKNIEQLELAVLNSERTSMYSEDAIHEIFRIMHTIKGSSAMMLFNHMSTLAHSLEDLFFFLREQKPKQLDCSRLTDLVLDGIDFLKVELAKIKNGDMADGDAGALIQSSQQFLALLKEGCPEGREGFEATERPTPKQQYYIAPRSTQGTHAEACYKAVIRFDAGCEMENIRAYSVVHHLKELASEIYHHPEELIENDSSLEEIREHGFTVWLRSGSDYQTVHDFFNNTIFLRNLEFQQLLDDQELKRLRKTQAIVLEDAPVQVPKLAVQAAREQQEKEGQSSNGSHSIISVNVSKMDRLMDLVGEMVIAEAMVTQNPDLQGLQLDNFYKAVRQLRKITGELQDLVMSIRMVPLANTFHKMQRVVRDMNKKLDKEVRLEMLGAETEVDKNIIEHLSDPLMHLVRNSLDHGIETPEERVAKGKPAAGTVVLEAKNAGSDVLVIVRDDGKGLSKERILQKARDQGVLQKPESEMTDRDIYNLIFLPGFSTKDQVTEFSGRGVGMDVVTKNLEAVGGSISVDSTEHAGTVFTLKIPLTLAIIDGMNIRVGSSRYTLPTIAIKESFRPKADDVFTDPEGSEMIMVRGQCYPVLRLHELYHVRNAVLEVSEGVLIMAECDEKTVCILADELLGQQQVVVKGLPSYIQRNKKVAGLTGCTLLGDGSISLILDMNGLVHFAGSA